jgi:hypothetical protein
VYDVRGRIPAYVPPDPRALASSIDTGRRGRQLAAGAPAGGPTGAPRQPPGMGG